MDDQLVLIVQGKQSLIIFKFLFFAFFFINLTLFSFLRCEILLNSARLNSGVQISTRNSCKTLKCPQCNWHYKYQETLEIHMREKHPDGESACGYCLAGKFFII